FGTYPPVLWHGHEMLFGFVGAAIAGFLLTAVPSWTGARGFGGLPLMLLAVIWMAGRVAFAGLGSLPFAIVAILELQFLPALAVLVAPPLVRSRNRNTPLLFVLLALWMIDVYFLLALSGEGLAAARHSLLLAIDVVLLLVTVIGGRIVPAFTASGLRQAGIVLEKKERALLDGATIVAMVAVVVADLLAPWQTAAGWVAALAALLHAARLAGWQGQHSLRMPLVWCLHLAYAWIPIGFGLKAIHLLAGGAWSGHWLHGLTIGAAAAMILAVMTRASLGHTGRPLVAAAPVAVAYLLLSACALVRVLAPALPGANYLWTVMLAGLLWLAAFALFLVVYTPILFRPRVDGRPG
ncbi:MAG TPA: NnrS family protein, partial [Steroidobacteraceae bacterium]|nr:NnrS family protein [Steroidobacteraceae bacterium]